MRRGELFADLSRWDDRVTLTPKKVLRHWVSLRTEKKYIRLLSELSASACVCVILWSVWAQFTVASNVHWPYTVSSVRSASGRMKRGQEGEWTTTTKNYQFSLRKMEWVCKICGYQNHTNNQGRTHCSLISYSALKHRERTRMHTHTHPYITTIRMVWSVRREDGIRKNLDASRTLDKREWKRDKDRCRKRTNTFVCVRDYWIDSDWIE